MPKNAKPPGTASPQRTDRNNAAVQSTDPGPQGQHGQRAQLSQALKAVPLADEQGRFQQALAAARNTPSPSGGIGRPSDRPGEPITAGLPVGPGSNERAPVTRGVPPGAASASQLAQYLPILETIASRPDASAAAKALVFRIRGSMPAEAMFGQAMTGAPDGVR